MNHKMGNAATLYVFVVGLTFAAIIGLFTWYSVASALIGAVLIGAVLYQVRADYKGFLYSPIGLFYAFLIINCSLVPLLWDLGYAQPWPEISEQLPQVAIAGICITFVATAAILPATRSGSTPDRLMLACPSAWLRVFLVVALCTGIVGLAFVSIAAGGFETLVSSLTARRSVLQSTGPLLVLISIPAVASVVGVLSDSRGVATSFLILLNVALYMFACLSMGNRFQSLVVVFALIVAYSRRRSISNKVVLACLVPAIPLSVLYLYVVRQGLSSGTAQGEIATKSVSEFLRSVLGPFVEGGLDVLRTVAAVFYDSELLALRGETILGSLVGVVPRSLWPNKPVGSSIDFSVEYFSLSWARGTGVPPAFPAELIFCFGLAGGLTIFAVAVYAVARLTERMMSSSRIGTVLLYPFIAADCIVLMKAGFDSFSKLAFVHACAVGLVVLVMRPAIRVHRFVPSESRRLNHENSAVQRGPIGTRAIPHTVPTRHQAKKSRNGPVALQPADDVRGSRSRRPHRIPGTSRLG
jgi:hypothetical protein